MSLTGRRTVSKKGNKRFILFGDRPYGGGWGGYSEAYGTVKEAKLAAIYWLDKGYDAHLLDNKTGEQSELRYKYDGLGAS